VATIRPAARRYAEAIYDLGRQGNSLDAWANDLQRLADLLEVPVAEKALTSPAVPVQQKLSVIDTEVPNLQPQARNLLLLLLHRDRLNILPEIAAAYREALNKARGIVTAQVTTAIPLDAEGQAEVAARLARYTGQQVQLETSVDPAILGGVIARVGDLRIDGSVRGRLEGLRRRLAASGRL
jgi:F-type H+-transporting ATPase subunit delta